MIKCVNFVVLQLFIACVFVAVSYSEENQYEITLYRHELVGDGKTNCWSLPIESLEKAPVWLPGDKEPPVSLGTIAKRAKAWVVSKGGSPNARLIQIEIRPVDPSANGDLGKIYFYNLRFGNVGYLGQYIRCIVLMDGTIIEPSRGGRLVNSKSYSDYAE